MKKRQFDAFSFRAPSSRHSIQDSLLEIKQQQHIQKAIKPQDINFRHLQDTRPHLISPTLSIFDRDINQKVNMINQQLDSNIKRRLQLERQLSRLAEQEKEHQKRQMVLQYSRNMIRGEDEAAREFRKMEERVDDVDGLVAPKREQSQNEIRVRAIQKSKDILLKGGEGQSYTVVQAKEKVLIPIVQTLASRQPKPLPVYTVPDQVKLQGLLRKATFPQMPKTNLQSIAKEAEAMLAVHQPHSDIHLLLMIIYFHQQKYLKVRQHFQHIMTFKIVDNRAYWVAAQAQFSLNQPESCLRLTEQCMGKLEQRCLPRLVYMKARCQQQQGNYVNSLVCYNQLLKMKPKVAEYYLQRGILYHRIGYYSQAREDLTTFGILQPQAQQHLKERIIAEKEEGRRRELIAIMAKIF